jgi:aspartate--ammonia ligase
VITKEDRNPEFLRTIVGEVYDAVVKTEHMVCRTHNLNMEPMLPESITFVSTEELERKYPALTRKERENVAAREAKALFITGIGWNLKDGKPHDGRAPDYDDWNLNGDIVVWNPMLEAALELSSMGIRVDGDTMLLQLGQRNALDRLGLMFHKMLMDGKLPLSVGGGIGQSRLCMLLLRKAHIGEVQASEWPDEMIAELKGAGIELLSPY